MLEKFVPLEFHKTADNSIFIGTIEGVKAICVVPSVNVSDKEIRKILQEENTIIQENDIYRTFSIDSKVNLNIRLIYPAKDSYVKKYTSKSVYTRETYGDYLKYINSMTSPFWVDNIINGNTSEEIYYRDDNFVLTSNYKWNRSSKDDLQLLLLFTDKRLKTIRDITNVKILTMAKKLIRTQIVSFGLKYQDVVVFFHYKPTYFQLHLHIMNINLSGSESMSVTRAKLLDEVIDNLSHDINYYKRVLYFGDKN